jgi:hypothetical protein
VEKYSHNNNRIARSDLVSPQVRDLLMEIIVGLYTVTEFCEAVRISIRQYYRLRAAGDGPRLTILGGVHLVSHDETKRWLTKHTERNWIDV